MGFNYAKERRKFEAEWRKLRQEYEQVGMDEQAIEQIYLFDLKVFCAGRVYENHTQQMPDMYTTENLAEHSSLLKKFESLSVTFDESDFFSEDQKSIFSSLLFDMQHADEPKDIYPLKVFEWLEFPDSKGAISWIVDETEREAISELVELLDVNLNCEISKGDQNNFYDNFMSIVLAIAYQRPTQRDDK